MHHRGLHRGAQAGAAMPMPRTSAQNADVTIYENILVGSTVIHRLSEFREYDKLSMICSLNVPQD